MSQIGSRQRETVSIQERRELQTINIQRNPYLAEYDVSRKTGQRQTRQRQTRQRHSGERAGSSRETGRSTGEYAGSSRKTGRSIGERAGSSRETGRNTGEKTRSRRIAERRRRAQRRRMQLRLLAGACILVICTLLYRVLTDKPQVDGSVPPAGIGTDSTSVLSAQTIQGLKASDYLKHPVWTEDFLTVNEYSRPGDELKEINNIFVHYTANPGTSAAQNRSYFEQLKDTRERSASSHFIIGYEGEILQCVPLNEIAYAVQGRNEDSISIECCYKAENGSFTQETYDSLIELLGWLTEVYNLETDDILRHYDSGGKKCPLYYTEHEDAWEKLKRDVESL